MAFKEAAKDWQELLQDVGEPFVARHLDATMQLAVALHCGDEPLAAELANSVDVDGPFLALTDVLRRLLCAAFRDQTALLQSLPDAFRLRFRQLLERSWSKLSRAAGSTISLPRVQQLDFSVAADGNGATKVLVRLQTSDGGNRTIHVPLKQFHQLRYTAAAVLQEMNQVEAHPMMRLANMEQSSRVVATGDAPEPSESVP